MASTLVERPPDRPAPPGRPHVRGLLIAGAAAAVLAVLFAAVAGFALRDPAPHDVPVAVLGPPGAAQQVGEGLDRSVPGGFEVVALPGDGVRAASGAVADRTVDGALVLGPEGATVVVASALGGSSTAIQAALSGAATAAGATEVSVVDAVPAPGDPRGVVLQQLVFACAVAGLAFAGLGYFLGRGAPLLVRLAVPLAMAITVGTLVAVVADPLLGSLSGNLFGLAGVLTLMVLAVTVPAGGLARLIGPGALGLVGFLVVLLGNPVSGATLSRDFLPAAYRFVAALIPNGAAVDGVRSAVFFGGSGLGRALVVLGCWIVAGYLLIALAHGRELRQAE